MGSLELQIFVSLFVILGAAFVALLCDFLKGNNERLRERNIELQTRHEERDKREKLLEQAQRHAWNVAVQAQDSAASQLAAQSEAFAAAEAAKRAEEETRLEAERKAAEPPTNPAEEIWIPGGQRREPSPQDDARSHADPNRLVEGPILPLTRKASVPAVERPVRPMKGLVSVGPQYPPPVLPEPASSALGIPLIETARVEIRASLKPENDFAFSDSQHEAIDLTPAPSHTTAVHTGKVVSLPSYLPKWLPESARSLAPRTLPMAGGVPIPLRPAQSVAARGYWTLVARWPIGRRFAPAATSVRAPSLPGGQLCALDLIPPVSMSQAAVMVPFCLPLKQEASPQLPQLLAGRDTALRTAGRVEIVISSLAPIAQPPFAAAGALERPSGIRVRFGLESNFRIDAAFEGAAIGAEIPGYGEAVKIPLSAPLARQLHATVRGTWQLSPKATPAAPALPVRGLSTGTTVPVELPAPMRSPLQGRVPELVALETGTLAGASSMLQFGAAPAGRSSLAGLFPLVTSAGLPRALAVASWKQSTLALPSSLVVPGLKLSLPGLPHSAQTLPVPLPAICAGVFVPRECSASHLGVEWAGPVNPERSCSLQLEKRWGLCGATHLNPRRLPPVVQRPENLTIQLTEEIRIPAFLGLPDTPVQITSAEGKALSGPEPAKLETSSFHPFAPSREGDAIPYTPALPQAQYALDEPGSAPRASEGAGHLASVEPVVKIRVLRDEELRPITGPAAIGATTPFFFHEAQRQIEFCGEEPVMETTQIPLEENCVVEGGFAYDPVQLQPSPRPASRVVVMPAFDDLRTLFYPIAPSLDKRLDLRPNLREMPGGPKTEWLPAGLHPAGVLERALRKPEPFAGAVMVVAISDYDKTVELHGEEKINPILDEVLSFISEAAGQTAFLCRSSSQELVIAWPVERLENPQRVFHAITEKLWDYQLRSLGGVTIIFTWGLHESQGGSLLRALEGARLQMLETRRHRKSTIIGVGRFRRQMVS